MTPTTMLVEPSFDDLLAAIEKADDLPEQTRRHWVCSARQVAKWLNRPAVELPARWNAIRLWVGQLHHARVGVTAKTFANHKSNLRAALRWFGNEHGVPQMGTRLTPEWTRLRNCLERPTRDRLIILSATARPAGSIHRPSTTRSSRTIGLIALNLPDWR
jgi:hypothetical protein